MFHIATKLCLQQSCVCCNSSQIHQASLLLQNTYLPTMPEDYLPEAKSVLGGRFYGKYFSMKRLLFHSFMLLWYSFLYFRVSKRSPLLSGRCKWFHNFVIIGKFQIVICHCTVWRSCSAKHMQCVWCNHWRSWLETSTRQQRCKKVSFSQ